METSFFFYLMSVQVTGLPGSGKSYGIDLFQATTGKHPKRFDIASIGGPAREQQFKRYLVEVKEPHIAESACGIVWHASYVVRLTISLEHLYMNLRNREGSFDPDYLSLLSQQMIRPDITVASTEDLQDLLDRLF